MGFVGRQLIYRISVDGIVYGAISAGSATRFLPGRVEFFGSSVPLNNLVSNTFFHIEKQNGIYPFRNFSTAVVKAWREFVEVDWPLYYGDLVRGWEALVELPRTGELYSKDRWVEVGRTKGNSCRRVGGAGTDSWGGKRVWAKGVAKRVFVRNVD